MVGGTESTTNAPTSEEDEAWVLQAPCTRIHKKSHPTRSGTHRTVASSVGKFPFRPRDNRRHDNSGHKQNRPAAAAIAIASTPSPTTPTPSSSYYPEDAIKRAFAKFRADLYSLILSMPPPTTTPNLSLPQHQPPSHPTPSNKRVPTLTTASRRKPVEHNRQNRRNRNNSAQPSPVPPPQQPMTTTTPSSPQPLHPEPSSPNPTSFCTPTAPIHTVTDTPNASTTTTDNPDPSLLPVTKLPPPMQQPTTTPTQPSPPHSLPLSLTLLPTPPTPATPTPLISLSLMERLIHNNTPAHVALWIPDALQQQHALHRTTTISNPTGHHPKLPTDSLHIHPVITQHCLLTIPDDRHHGFARSPATIPPPAPNPPDPSTQPHHTMHQTTAEHTSAPTTALPVLETPLPGQATSPTHNLCQLPTAMRHHRCRVQTGKTHVNNCPSMALQRAILHTCNIRNSFSPKQANGLRPP